MSFRVTEFHLRNRCRRGKALAPSEEAISTALALYNNERKPMSIETPKPKPTHPRPDPQTESAPPAPDQKLIEKLKGLAPGRIVRAVVRGPYQPGESTAVRPAIVVKADFQTGTVNLQIFTDGMNDRAITGGRGDGVIWGVGYLFDADESRAPGTWHWPN